ncbi:TetR/AcrR family transcriptional regulator [Kurthia senegalensis]|uniref:TetR/AcrR family transcriptional regulator n=1 Tax=Kurthia senegalensis TaxID=1033740 RepID=UPI000287D680|nr:TetR family transcriptional regulator [Kurthia senegalensis]
MNKKLDPRAVKTRQQIIDAFQQLIQTKYFEQITVTHITELAHINRATFYAHFIDKYELLETALHAITWNDLEPYFKDDAPLDHELLEKVLLSIMHIHEKMNVGCRRGYATFNHMIEEKIKSQLIELFEKKLPADEKLIAVFLSWGLYGAFIERAHDTKEDDRVFAKRIALQLTQKVDIPKMVR